MADEFIAEFELDEIDIGIDRDDEPIDLGLPKIYLYLENLIMINQVKGLVEEAGDLIVPAYADKRGEPALVGLVELTSENILTMQHLGLKVTLIREGKNPINFDKADDFVAIVKTLRKSDTEEIEDIADAVSNL